MAKPTQRQTCKVCGRHRDEVGQMSWTGKCGDCGQAVLRENIMGLHTMSGPALDRWRRGMAASVGGVILDDVRAAD